MYCHPLGNQRLLSGRLARSRAGRSNSWAVDQDLKMRDSGQIDATPGVSANADQAARFDVFLSHNSRDKAFVERLAERLKRERLQPWIDVWQLVPGMDWQRGLAEGLAASASCAVFVGPSDLGAWESHEAAAALDRAATDRDFRLFLVLLPGLPDPFDATVLSPFLRRYTWVDFRRGLDDERAFRALVCAIQGLPLGPSVPIDAESDVCPYRGLEAFDEEHAEFFFGRDADVQRLVEIVKDARFLAVLGASGSGKSSLVRAGLLPALKQGGGLAEQAWEIVKFRPGAHPLEALAAQLTRLAIGGAMQQTLDGLGSDARTLHLAVSLALGEKPLEVRLLLVVDQFEEVFTLCREESERTALFANLLYAATVPGGATSVLTAMRADFYHRCGAYSELAQQLAATQYVVSPLPPEGLRQAVEEPARQVGLAFEPGLVATILADVAERPGALPLLEHALLEVWRRRQGSLLTLAGYRESGGVQGAIAKRAEDVFASLATDQQALAQRIFLRLTQPGEGTEDTRRRAALAELDVAGGDIAGVLSRLVTARLVVTSRDDTTGSEAVELSHEALIRGWPRLRAWIDEDRAGLRIQRRLTDAARDWHERNRDESTLYRGARLAEATEWRDENQQSLNALEREFLVASQARERSELEQARRRSRRLRALATALAVLLVAAVGAAVYAKRQSDHANAERRIASVRALAGTAVAYADTSPDIAMLLSLEAYQHAQDVSPANRFEARSSMVTALQRNSHLEAVLHVPKVSSVAFSPDGKTIAASALDANNQPIVQLWDMARHVPLGKPLRGGGNASNASFSPDGRTLALADEISGVGVRLWSLASHRPRGELLDLDLECWNAYFSPNGRTLAVTGYDSIGGAGPVVQLWDIGHNRPIGAPLRGVGNPNGASFSPDGTMLAVAGSGGLRLWRVTHPSGPGQPLRGHRGDVRSVAFSPDGKTLASGGEDGTVRFWDARRGVELGAPLDTNVGAVLGVTSWTEGGVTGVAFNRDGKLLASAQSDGTVRLWDVEHRGALSAPLQGHIGAASSIAFSPDGRTLASAGRDGTVRLWVVGARDMLSRASPTDGRAIEALASSADGRIVATAEGDSVQLWDVVRRARLGKQLVTGTDNARTVAFSPGGNLVASAGEDGKVRLWEFARRPTAQRPFRVEHRGQQFVSSLAFSSDGRTLAAAAEDGSIVLWDVTRPASSGKRIPLRDGDLLSRPGALETVAFSPDGALLATGGGDGIVYLYDVVRHQQLGYLDNSQTISSLAFSPNGKTLASAGENGIIRFWDVQRRRQLGESLQRDRITIGAIAFSPDGGTLAAVGSNGKLQLWDVNRRAPLGDALTGEGDKLSRVAFSRLGDVLISGSDDGTIRWWNSALASTELSAWQTTLCRIVRRNLTPSEWRRLIPDERYPSSSSDRSCPGFR
jgi:WD40 repeat protein